MSITWTDVIAIAPETAAVETGRRTSILAEVALQVPAETWGKMVDVGSAYLAAHLATVTGDGGSGPLTGEKVGPLSENHKDMLQFGEYGLTAYGVRFDQLLHQLPSALGMTT